jgi:hypothetical protein
VIDDDGRNNSYMKINEIDEEFYCHVLFDEPNERQECIADEAKESVEELLHSQEKDMINDAVVEPKRTPDVPQSTENLPFGEK